MNGEPSLLLHFLFFDLLVDHAVIISSWYNNYSYIHLWWWEIGFIISRFELGFFSSSNSNNWYLGIWFNKSPDTVWVLKAENRVAQLLDTRNFVLRDKFSRNTFGGGYLWQSFDCPSDSLIPGMKVGWDLKIVLELYSHHGESLMILPQETLLTDLKFIFMRHLKYVCTMDLWNTHVLEPGMDLPLEMLLHIQTIFLNKFCRTMKMKFI